MLRGCGAPRNAAGRFGVTVARATLGAAGLIGSRISVVTMPLVVITHESSRYGSFPTRHTIRSCASWNLC